MIDVFVKIFIQHTIRRWLAQAVLDRLVLMEHVQLWLLIAGDSKEVTWPTGAPIQWRRIEGDFWIRAKEDAEKLATSPIYIVIDDDHLPIGRTWLADGLAVLQGLPDYGMISSWSVNGEVPESPVRSDLVMPAESIGCPYFVRKGIIGEFPIGPLATYDTILTQHLNARGWKTGFAHRVRHNHLGMGYSQVVSGHWGA